MSLWGLTRRQIALKSDPKGSLDRGVYLESIISSMTDALIVIDSEATLRLVNNAALETLGYREEEVIGRPLKNFILKREEGLLHQYLQDIIAAGAALNMSLTFLTKQRERIPVNFSGAVMRQDGEIIGIAGVARDMHQIRAIISELEEKKREFEERNKYLIRMQKAMLHMMGDLDIAKKELEKANRELRTLDQLKSDFVAMVSHELRSPLTVTREAISQVLDGVCGETNKTQKQNLSMSIEGIDRLSRLIENLLDISKIEAHKIHLKKELTDIVSVAKEASSSFALVLQNKGLEAKYSFPEEKIELFVDKDRMVQVFVNLLSNSAKFTLAGHIEIAVVDKGTVVECSVSDTGIGISEGDLTKMFSKFEQFGREFESAEKGTGLGLAISKGIIELHGGRIWAESKLGQGTKISFTLPKYGPRELFKEYVTDGVAEAIKESAFLSIVVLDVKYSDALQERLGRDKTASIMRSLAHIIKTGLRRKSDMSIKDSRAILVVLPETDKRCAWSTADRLKLSSDDYLSREGLDKDIEVEIRVASFPEDGPSEEELLNEVGL